MLKFKTLILPMAAILAVLLLPLKAALSHDFKIGDLKISHPIARMTPPGAPVSGGYLIIKNMGDKADRLISATAAFAGKTEIHEMKMDEGVMKMRPLKEGVEIPAGKEIKLAPGGMHLMFMKLSETLKMDDKHSGTLVFEKAGTLEVIFKVGHVKAMKH